MLAFWGMRIAELAIHVIGGGALMLLIIGLWYGR
jgi:hypothetical protein